MFLSSTPTTRCVRDESCMTGGGGIVGGGAYGTCTADAATSEVGFFRALWIDSAYHTPALGRGALYARGALTTQGGMRSFAGCQLADASASLPRCLLSACVTQQGRCSCRLTPRSHHFLAAPPSLCCVRFYQLECPQSFLGLPSLPSSVVLEDCLHPLLSPQGGHGGTRHDCGSNTYTGVDLEPFFQLSPGGANAKPVHGVCCVHRNVCNLGIRAIEVYRAQMQPESYMLTSSMYVAALKCSRAGVFEACPDRPYLSLS